MKMLFDIAETSPPEDQKKRRGKSTGALFEMGKPSPEKAPSYIGDFVTTYLGRFDEVECVDPSCRGTAHDIVEEGMAELPPSNKPRPAWLIECCYCGTGQWVPVVEGYLKPAKEEFRLRDGRFAGMTLDEASKQPRGLDYIRWAAEEHKRPAVREASKTWLASNPDAL
jgi:hypothetical protein